MTPEAYQAAADRTKCSQAAALGRITTSWDDPPGVANTSRTQLLHAMIGLGGEVGELNSVLQKWLWYGKSYTAEELKTKFMDEFGDCLWYIAEGLNALGLSLQDLMDANIAKLRARYPEKYTDQLAAEENRDRRAENAALSKGTHSDPDFIPGQWNDPEVEPGDRSGV